MANGSANGPVLVTGATGFTGSHLTQALRQKGYRVRALVRDPGRLGLLEPDGIEIVVGDLADQESLRRACEGVETVYHVAALYRREGRSVREFYEVNVEGTRRLLEAAVSAGVARFLHCSTVGVQGEIRHPPATEETPYNPGDHYQRSKMLGELAALEFFRSTRLSGIVVRPAGIYGPGDRRFLKLFRGAARGTFTMIGDGEVLYQMTYVEDLVEGMILAAERREIQGEVFTLAGEEYLSLNELVRRIGRALGVEVRIRHVPVGPVLAAAYLCERLCRLLRVEPPLYPRRLDFFTKNRAFDISKAKTLLGYRPKVDLDTGLKRTAEWYRAHGWL
ncbi:MAG: NAD-dependent epimerase/dehydratase family protein [candidate division KSB1 bacterium]|nr:NAD-dependent epimerase/dehydratase family protein [candidate division KSB1 bacterium]